VASVSVPHPRIQRHPRLNSLWPCITLYVRCTSCCTQKAQKTPENITLLYVVPKTPPAGGERMSGSHGARFLENNQCESVRISGSSRLLPIFAVPKSLGESAVTPSRPCTHFCTHLLTRLKTQKALANRPLSRLLHLSRLKIPPAGGRKFRAALVTPSPGAHMKLH
jgi:hypothetical protein